MNRPHIEIIAVSNVYSRLMHFKNAGDIEQGHSHTYDHATLISAGAVRYEVLDGFNGNVVASTDFYAPSFVFVEKEKHHRLTALQDETICACIHALRSIDEEIVSPDCLIRPIKREWFNQIFDAVKEKTGKGVAPIILQEPASEALQNSV